MKSLIVRLLAVVGGIFILLMIVAVLAVSLSVSGKGAVPQKAILEMDLEKGLVEDVPQDSLAQLMMKGQTTVRDVVDTLERAANDKRVAGIVVRVGASGMGMAEAQEIRDAVQNFRSKGKFAYAWAETFGEWSPGSNSYYLASAFDQVYLQPSGDVNLTGIMMQGQFVKGTLDKLGVRFRGDQRYEYKNAMNTFTETKFTPAHKEAMEKVMNSWYGQIVRGISQSRNIPEDQLRVLVDKAPFYGQEALDAKLVDGLKYRDEVYGEAKKKAGNDAELLYAHKYLERAGRPHTKGQTVALIYGVGGVNRGKSGYDPLFGDVSMGSDTVSAAIRAAVDDKNVKAIILRVDSPGGSYIASDTIWREVVRAKQAGKPVIVSMGNLAASGGYFVAIPADKIVAQPGTITGSIGVLGGKAYAKGFFDKIGISFDEVHAGANATVYSMTEDYTPQGWQRLQAALDRIYGDFTTKVAEGRKLPKERVLQIAKGRIWSGEDAKALGLVDELGGFPVAIKLAKQAANIPGEQDVNLKVFPERKGFFERIMDKGPDSSEKEATAEVLMRTLQVIQPAARRVQMLVGVKDRELMTPIMLEQ